MDTPDMLANDSKAPLWSVPLMYEVVENTGAIYLCTRFDVAPMWQQALIDAGAILKTPIIWDKGNWTSGDLTGDYANQCELILFAHKGREHPTPKPVALMARCIHNSVNKGGTVLDPFMGSGSTGVAAIREGCHFIGIELELKYFDISCRRIEAEDSQLSIFDFME